MKTIKAVIVQNDTVKDFLFPKNNGLQALQDAVGGFIELVTLNGFSMYVNEEGKLNNLIINNIATAMVQKHGFGDIIVGPAVFFGSINDDGCETDISQKIKDELCAIANLYYGATI